MGITENVAFVALLILAGVLGYVFGNRDRSSQWVQRLEDQHATILAKLDERANGGAEREEYRNLGEVAGKLVDEYRRLILLSGDPREKERYEQMVREIKELM
jgi:hypothetical protein